MTVYLDLTREFNAGRLRAILTSDPAVVLHHLAVMSKDGDWILREDEEASKHVLQVLEGRRAQYRFGAPLDPRWLAGGWSSHLEFREGPLRVRTDFFSRPPRIPFHWLQRLWQEQEGRDPAFVDLRTLAEMKKTDRERDYSILGELARAMEDPRDQLLYSRSARDLIELAGAHPELTDQLRAQRPLLAKVAEGRDALEVALDAERRASMRANEERLERYRAASEPWSRTWAAIARELEKLPLLRAHERMVRAAEGVLPFHAGGGAP